jgi:hypothetical protein
MHKKNRNSTLKTLPSAVREYHNQVWCCTPVLPAFRRLRQEGNELEASLNYITRPCLKNPQNRN